MCMTVNEHETKKFLDRNKGKKKITVWKVYGTRNGEVRPCCRGDHPSVNQGYIVSDRSKQYKDSMDIEIDDWSNKYYIHRGIHVFSTRKRARRYCDYGEKVFKCTALINDFVALGGVDTADSDRAVFMKIHISKREFERGIKGRN